MGIQYFGKAAIAGGVASQPGIDEIDVSVVDETWDATEAAVLNELRTKVQTLIYELENLGLLKPGAQI